MLDPVTEGVLQPPEAPGGTALLPLLREAVRELPDVHLPARQGALHPQLGRAALRARRLPRHELRLPLLRASLPLEETAGQILSHENMQVLFQERGCAGQVLFHENMQVLFHENMQILFHENLQVLFHENMQVLFHENMQVLFHKNMQVLFHENLQVLFHENMQVLCVLCMCRSGSIARF